MVESEVDPKMGLDAEEEYIHGNHDGILVPKTPRVKTRVSMLETNAENMEITLWKNGKKFNTLEVKIDWM